MFDSRSERYVEDLEKSYIERFKSLPKVRYNAKQFSYIYQQECISVANFCEGMLQKKNIRDHL